MSGGSYCYLTYADDARDIAEKRYNLREMRDRLAGLAYAPRSTAATQRILDALDAIDAMLDDDIRDVWKAVEWRDSADWGDDDMREAIEKYEAMSPPASMRGKALDDALALVVRGVTALRTHLLTRQESTTPPGGAS